MNHTETQQLLDALVAARAAIAPEHDGNDFENECEKCHAYRDATAAIALCKESLARGSAE